VFPRLVAAHHVTPFERKPLESGLNQLDHLLGGGPQFGTSTLLIGPAGCGKTTVSMQYALAAAKQGRKVAVYLFDELRELLIDRFGTIGMDLREVIDNGCMTVMQVDPTQKSPGEFAAQVRVDVEQGGATLVVIDSLNGYMNAMPHEEFLAAQLHELLSYLGNRGVASFLVVAQNGIMGANMTTPVDASYLADAVILLRYFEAKGEVRQAISVVKKRGGVHERTIREFGMVDGKIRVGDPLRHFRGVLTGVPMSTRSAADALVDRAEAMGLRVAEVPGMFDVDVEADLDLLIDLLNDQPDAARATSQALRALNLIPDRQAAGGNRSRGS
jgi:circadian clock protein KaiC